MLSVSMAHIDKSKFEMVLLNSKIADQDELDRQFDNQSYGI